ncbi:MAG: hypothetical protein MHPSP_004941, partial [Paramarteilia canceri]
KNGHKIGESTLERHLNICKKQGNDHMNSEPSESVLFPDPYQIILSANNPGLA